ncbi:uncharacterized protein LOC105215249 [Zeugodacus cucurbitae]|uniref:Uncharacterized protein n=1 Tax=Zeugodacus cucurbitae TaxID=28588 RepID=A0A0A1XQY9_ZEUCU|nr:uncharacterized protein LOC105215249 [Zeugodacus cucurbitae]XP_011187368.2 uncharacterized protein LOC105215249 [Zeugodacus cucurbitae]XP_054084331.1 uncharacterized protein LOC105215249 [Zeugodacus cucurbitae]XP_054084332.1 uncharacterized protein LOC105215249 [Zeugodacus cucurbitae]
MNAPLKMLLHAKGITISATFSIWLLCCCLPIAESLIVPQELPSILSLIYSNIPPIKKGTDSRLGFGFRLGNHADFQVLLELGPQKNTRPIGEDADSENTFNKRQVSKSHRAHLLRKQAQEAFRQLATSTTSTTTERTANSWLESWSNAMNTNNNAPSSAGIAASKKKSAPKYAQNTVKKQQQLETFAPPAANNVDQSMQQLQMLYRMATSSSSTTISPVEIYASTEAPVMIVTPEPQLQRLRPTFVPYKGGSLNLGGPVGFTPRPLEELALQTISEQPSERKSKSEITKELMDVSLEEGQ